MSTHRDGNTAVDTIEQQKTGVAIDTFKQMEVTIDAYKY